MDIIAIAKANGKRKSKPLRDIPIPAMFATDLYRAAYAPVVRFWQAKAARVADAYAIPALTRDGISEAGNEIAQAELELSSAFFSLSTSIRSIVQRVEVFQRRKFGAAIRVAIGFDPDRILLASDVEPIARAIIQRNVGLVKDVSDQARSKMEQIILDAHRLQTPARDVAKQLRGVHEFARDRSVRIASDQLSKLGAALADERATQLGFEEYVWNHSGKLHFRPHHKARDGKRFKYGEPEGDRPGFAPYCGCRAQPYINLDE